MNNFIFENATKTFFGKGCVGEYLCCLAGHYGKNVLLCYGGGAGVFDDEEVLRWILSQRRSPSADGHKQLPTE